MSLQHFMNNFKLFSTKLVDIKLIHQFTQIIEMSCHVFRNYK